MKSRLLLLTRLLQLVTGLLVLFFGYGIWLDFWTWDVSLGFKVDVSKDGLLFLMLVLPGLLVATGSYLQTIYYKAWALVLVGPGCFGAAIFIGGNALFFYAYTGMKWGIRAVLADLCFVALTFALAITNAIVLKRPATVALC
jgi:hypothetical protein